MLTFSLSLTGSFAFSMTFFTLFNTGVFLHVDPNTGCLRTSWSTLSVTVLVTVWLISWTMKWRSDNYTGWLASAIGGGTLRFGWGVGAALEFGWGNVQLTFGRMPLGLHILENVIGGEMDTPRSSYWRVSLCSRSWRSHCTTLRPCNFFAEGRI